MSRTTRYIFIKCVTIEQAKTVVLKWFAENKVKVGVNTSDYVFGRWGRGILTASKFFEVTLESAEGGVVAKTEGWITGVTASPFAKVYLPEQEFSDSAFSFGGIPRKEGMKAIKRLWNALEVLSKST
jgi:hypothetical protein